MQKHKPIPWLTVAGVLAGVLCVLALIAGLLLFGRPKRTVAELPTRSELRAMEEQKLSSYARTEEPGVVRIPAERAAELLVKERGAK